MWQSLVGLLEAILRALTDFTGSLGLGIILFTVFTRIALLPLTIKQLQSSKKMQELQPFMQELRRKYGKDPQKLQQETMKLYKEHKANPVGGCLPLVIQLPIFIGVWQAVSRLTNPTDPIPFLWLPSLGDPDPYYILPVLSIVLQMLVSLMAMPKIQDAQQKMMSQMMVFMPILFGYIAFTFASGAVLYWVMGSLWSVVQQYFVTGWGSLSNYLTFLPERKGYMTPVVPVLPAATETTESDPTAEQEPGSNFWNPLAKLQTTAVATGDTATEAAIADARQQGGGKKRRR